MTDQLSNSSFTKYLRLLVSGTVVAQIINAASLPFLARIYSPQDFEILAVFNAITSLFAIVACLRFETAIPFVEKEKEAKILVVVSLILATICSVLVVIILGIVPSKWISSGLGSFYNTGYFWLIPLAIFSLALFNVVQSWFTRLQKFKFIAGIRVLQASGASGAQLSLGLLGWGPLGLILGYLCNSIVGGLVMGITMFKGKVIERISIGQLKTVVKKNKNYPKYLAWESLFNSGTIQLPVLMIAALGIGPEAGYLAISMYLLQVPMILIGNSIGYIYHSEAPKAFRNNSLPSFNINMLSRLSTLGMGPLIFAGVISPSIFVWIFGAEWSRAGEMVRFMAPWFILQFMASPLSLAFTAIGRQDLAAKLQASGLLVRTGSVLVAAFVFPEYIVEVFALSGVVFYGYYLVFIFKIIKSPWLLVLKAFLGNVWVTMMWVIAGIVVIFSESIVIGLLIT